jgi:hypothetical protein
MLQQLAKIGEIDTTNLCWKGQITEQYACCADHPQRVTRDRRSGSQPGGRSHIDGGDRRNLALPKGCVGSCSALHGSKRCCKGSGNRGQTPGESLWFEVTTTVCVEVVVRCRRFQKAGYPFERVCVSCGVQRARGPSNAETATSEI